MRRLFAWTMTLAAGASTVSIAFGQAPKNQSTQRPAAKATAPATGPRAGGAPAAAPLSPAELKAKQAADAKARGEMDLLLDEWEKQSKKVTSLQVVFERIDRSLKWGDQVYQGQAILKSPDLACLEFKKAVDDGQGKPVYKTNDKGQKVLDVEKEPFQRIVCTGKEVLQFEFDEKAIYVYPLDKEARQKALQQGPLPFLFNMKAADARQRYGMTLLDQTKDEYTIAIIPREEIDKQSFNKAFVRLSKANFLPNYLVLLPVGEKEKQEFRFTMIAPNQVVPEGYFHPSIDLVGWKVNRNEEVGKTPAAGQSSAPAGRPVQNLAKKPATSSTPRATARP